MPSTPRNRNEVRPSTRSALLDAAEQLMLQEGYAAVTSRRVGEQAGISPTLIYYYFHTMDDLLVEVLRRRLDESLKRQSQALSSDPQPLWALWEWAQYRADTPIYHEFLALANHNKGVREQFVKYSNDFFNLRLQVIATAFDRYGIDRETWPPAALHLVLQSIWYALASENVYGIDIGHAELTKVIERLLRDFEGERTTPNRAFLGARRVKRTTTRSDSRGRKVGPAGEGENPGGAVG
jgi:AcrR family transcriptional regulator